uniref:ShKT domain-containing protein n=1 Tax=Strongyloides venezuelensis TaxID=75913 RepID=A0A0K0G2A0_STRVS
MYYYTFNSIFLIYFLRVNFVETGNTKICAANADCTDPNTKCLKDVDRSFDKSKGNFCGLLCDVAKVNEQCGGGETCDKIKDTDNADVLSCVKTVQCITDAFCANINSAKPECNLYTLQCVGPDTTTTSTTTTTKTTRKFVVTTTAIVDLVPGGTFGCDGHVKYCTDPLWLNLMKRMCPKTCGYTTNTGTGNTGTGGCRDVYLDCAKNINLCKYSLYKKYMRENCAKTCNRC